MRIALCVALVMNAVIVGCEISIFIKVKDKVNVVKYYTFLQNFIALIVSIVFLVYGICSLIAQDTIPEFVKGLRYTATCGLAATMFVFAVILAPRYKSGSSSSHSNIFCGLNPQKANFLLHYLCPVISIVSFVFFERQTVLSDSEWTGYAAIPSCAYWILYILLTAAHLWKEPYGLTAPRKEKKNHLLGLLLMLIIPGSFILMSYLLYWVNLI